MAGRARRIALFSPFWGGNLGDAAILRAIIEHLRGLDAGAELVAITMDEHSMVRTHGVQGTRITGAPVRFFSYFEPEPPPPRSRAAKLARAVLGIPRWITRHALPEMRHVLHACRFLRRVDVLVFAGGGQLDEEWGGPWGLPYSQLKWALLARVMGARVAFVSVGVCKMQSPLGRWFARSALRLAAYVSVRDPWSREFIEQVLSVPGVLDMPDAAFGLAPGAAGLPPATRSPLTVGVSPIAYGRPEHWPTHDTEVARRYFSALVEFTRERLRAGDRVVLFSTDGPDRHLVAEMQAALQEDATAHGEQRLHVENTRTVDDLLPILARLDAVVVSRLHGVILSHLVHRPVLAISYDRKVSAHMSQAGQERFCIEFGEATHETVTRTFAALVAESAAVHATLHAKTEAWRAALDAQYTRVLELAGPRLATAKLAAESGK